MIASLTSAQRWLINVITDKRPPNRLAQLGGSRLSAKTGLAIYRHAYRARLVDCLVEDFPALQSLLGTKHFARLANEVITAMHPDDATLNCYGIRLVKFLRQNPNITRHGRLALDLARLEWALIEAIHALLEPDINPAAFKSIPVNDWAQVRLQPSPSLRLIASSWNIDACYIQYQKDDAVTVPPKISTVVAIVRRLNGLERCSFSPQAGRLIRRLALGMTLGEAVNGSRLDPETVGSVIRKATAFGCFKGVIRPSR